MYSFSWLNLSLLFIPLMAHHHLLSILLHFPLILIRQLSVLVLNTDSSLKMDADIKQTVTSLLLSTEMSCQNKTYPKTAPTMSQQFMFITSWLDYSNSVLIGVSTAALSCQNVHFRIRFRMLRLTFKALNGLSPTYLSGLLTPYKLCMSLLSAEQHLLQVPKPMAKEPFQSAP